MVFWSAFLINSFVVCIQMPNMGLGNSEIMDFVPKWPKLWLINNIYYILILTVIAGPWRMFSKCLTWKFYTVTEFWQLTKYTMNLKIDLFSKPSYWRLNVEVHIEFPRNNPPFWQWTLERDNNKWAFETVLLNCYFLSRV